MSGPQRAKSLNGISPEVRSVLAPAGNKARSVEPLRKQPIAKSRAEKAQEPLETSFVSNGEARSPSESGSRKNVPRTASILRQSLSLNASTCSSDASTESSSSRSRPSTGGVRSNFSAGKRSLKKKIKERDARDEASEGNQSEETGVKKRCAWVTVHCDPLYTSFHDEEWGLPVHDDRKLFELLTFSTALAELAWPVILSRRPMFREIFLGFDPIAVSMLNEKRLTSAGSTATSLLSELKLRAVIDNARQICKIINEFGSFDKYVWSFVNHKPIIGNFRYPRQVPIKTSKAETISKDLVRRGFRGVGPTVVYSFMQACGMTNDHLITCFRYHDCLKPIDSRDNNNNNNNNNIDGVVSVSASEENSSGDLSELELVRDIHDMTLSR